MAHAAFIITISTVILALVIITRAKGGSVAPRWAMASSATALVLIAALIVSEAFATPYVHQQLLYGIGFGELTASAIIVARCWVFPRRNSRRSS